jgi:molybdopterin synthase catalytic subunit
MTDFVGITDSALRVDALIEAVRRDADGAVVTFVGTVRSPSRGKTVLFIEYEAFQPEAIRRLDAIRGEAKDKWGVDDVAVWHRVGKVPIGEPAVVIAVAAPHRKEAFAACQYVIDRIKQIVPIWKKEVYSDGEAWVTDSA